MGADSFTHSMDQPIAFTFSPLLHTRIESIDQYRDRLLTIPLLPRKEIALRTYATEVRILTALKEARIPMTATELSRLLNTPPKRPHPMEREALMYRQALIFVRNEWTGKPGLFSHADIEVLMHISGTLSFPRISRIIQESADELSKLIAYCNASNDHPILLTGIVHAYMTRTVLHTFSRGRITLLMTVLMLARAGYDARSLLPLESTLFHDQKAYEHALTSIESYGQMTIWLEYFATCVLEAYKTLELHIETILKTPEKRVPFSLINDRQKQILILLDAYGTKVTNRDVQKRFGISQITASRDLTRLVSAGYLLARGKGRSVSYELA